jgi:exodeoxyribonuclease VII small subunit
LPDPADTATAAPKTAKSARTPKASADRAAVAASYEEAMAELERLVAQLDAGQLPLDQLLTHYQRGAQLLAFCKSRLEAVENQIQLLDGEQLKPWDAA